MAQREARHALVHAVIEAVNARDFRALAQMPFDPTGEFRSAIAAVEGTVYTGGVEGLRQWAEDVDATWDGFRIQVLEIHDVDDDRVLILFRSVARAKGSGLPLDALTAQMWTWRNGVIWRNDSYTDPQEAFKAAGLRH